MFLCLHVTFRSSIRDSSLRDLRANSGELSRIGSNNEILNSLIKPEREADNSQQIGKDNDENAAPRFQSGVLRTNCIDCLDRTNVAQYAYGLEALGRQLHAMGLTDRPKVDADSSIAAALMDMYQGMGDALAQQYGGSAAHNTVFPERQGKWKATTQSREFLKSIKRYYSNAYTDGEKQDAINLFLGYFQPREGKPALWELDSDYYLHVSGIGDDLIPDYGLSFDGSAVGQGTTLVPVPACREDFLRMKLTSFDKLLERTCCHIKNVRLCSETDKKSGNSGVAPDAAEIQLKSPNWLFGQRKYDDSNSASKVSSHAVSNGASNGENEADGLGDLSWISGVTDLNQEDIFKSLSRCWCLLKDLALISIVGLIATEALKEPVTGSTEAVTCQNREEIPTLGTDTEQKQGLLGRCIVGIFNVDEKEKPTLTDIRRWAPAHGRKWGVSFLVDFPNRHMAEHILHGGWTWTWTWTWKHLNLHLEWWLLTVGC
ncbi:Phosphoinositide phosphatase SAC1 [Capsicum baccatum]|uniref:Phosphoinositide phosphatase SAC1 n=1 Tax=Capsicum baccatum TaxID=33114 RepID=A0A2G2WZK5_CAPBA|nr:Phosphoinositide phosphatase SAC1 [Capsicum baccatum]